MKQFIFMLHWSTMYTTVACCYRLTSVVCQSVTVGSPAETTELIEMLFGMLSRVVKLELLSYSMIES